MNDNIETKGIEAAEKFLTHRGYEIITKDFDEAADFVAKDPDGAIVFIRVETKRGWIGDSKTASRAKLEQTMLRFFVDRGEYADHSVRFDTVSVMVVSDDRAVIRHHLNSLGGELVTNLEWLAKHDPETLLGMIDPEHRGWLGQPHDHGVECGDDRE